MVEQGKIRPITNLPRRSKPIQAYVVIDARNSTFNHVKGNLTIYTTDFANQSETENLLPTVSFML